MSSNHTPVLRHWTGLINMYRDRMPFAKDWEPVTLNEGGTPLLRANHLSELTGCDVYLKIEGANPTGSFKDRGMTVAVTDAFHKGQQVLMCASTGNTSASAAAYAARAGMQCAVLIPEGKIAQGKLAQAVMHGAQIIQVRGNFDDCLEMVRKTTTEFPEIALVNSVNPMRIEGQKTASFEVVDCLGDAPDVHVLPVGNAGNITAYWKGYKEYADAGVSSKSPVMLGVQAAGAAPLVKGEPVLDPETVATAIRIGNPASWQQAMAVKEESGGNFRSQTDEQILKAYHLVASKEGVFVEPASASSVAGLLDAHAHGELTQGQRIVCTVTGHGLKDPTTALAEMPEPQVTDVDTHAIAEALGLE